MGIWNDKAMRKDKLAAVRESLSKVRIKSVFNSVDRHEDID